MTAKPILPLLLGSALSFAPLGHAAEVLPAASDLPATPELPDPLVMFDGTRVTSKRQWFEQRRPELKRLFEHYMYGAIPTAPAQVRSAVKVTYGDFLGGKATLKLVTISFGDPAAPRIDLLLAVPNQRRGRAPVFLAMNFCGNHALTSDPRVPLTRGWVYSSCAGCQDGRATEAGRGSQAGDWALEQTIERGYAFASFCSSDVDSDRAEVSDGVYAWLANQRGAEGATAQPRDRGTIAAWAWGFSRCVDYLVTDSDLHPRRIAVVGHSRNGKTALLAAAFDERIALSIPLQAGCGGTAPSRGKVGESVKQINDRFPHWFNGAFKDFNDRPDRLPFDQHGLVALVAPRPVLFANAVEDQWANPAGQFDILKAADPVYRFLEAGGLEAQTMPPTNRLVSSTLGYFIRPGKHSMRPVDWQAFLDFADAQFGIKRDR
ncbi:MAG: acetylxylan esterase [Verrucomicrobia bacterium]|nr:acetylxylan esterase [Verrucomicrobiota bacterium]